MDVLPKYLFFIECLRLFPFTQTLLYFGRDICANLNSEYCTNSFNPIEHPGLTSNDISVAGSRGGEYVLRCRDGLGVE